MDAPHARLIPLAFVMVALGGMEASAGCLITKRVAISNGMSNRAQRLSCDGGGRGCFLQSGHMVEKAPKRKRHHSRNECQEKLQLGRLLTSLALTVFGDISSSAGCVATSFETVLWSSPSLEHHWSITLPR